MKQFQGRVVAPGEVKAEALVSHGGLNTLASFQKALQFGDKKATCGDQNNPDLYGHEMAGKIDQRIGEIGAADTVEMMIQFRIGRCHPLTQNRKGQYAVDLVHPYRLVFEKKGNEIQIANILEIVDYHK